MSDSQLDGYEGEIPQTDSISRHRLPTLLEVLSRRTLPPVDLFCFYVYMRDQQRSVDYLDFWLDVSQHMQLCRHYVRELRQSVLFETPDLEKAGSKRSSRVLDSFDQLRDNDSAGQGRAQSMRSNLRAEDQRLSQFLRDNASSHNGGGRNGDDGDSHKDNSSTSSSAEALPAPPRNRHGNNGSNDTSGGRPSEMNTPPRPSFMGSGLDRFSSSPGNDSSTPRNPTVARNDIRSNAEKILYTYLLPGSEREIILPQQILGEITSAIEEQGRDDPEVFDAAKDYVYQAMERDAFPGFLKAKALGNLVPPDLLVHLIAGLLGMFGAFWAAFACVFLDKSRALRCFLIIPFGVGVFFLASHQYTLNPILVLLSKSEYTFLNFVALREPFVTTLLRKRAFMCLFWVFIVSAALCVLFIFVPGKRL